MLKTIRSLAERYEESAEEYLVITQDFEAAEKLTERFPILDKIEYATSS